MEKSSGLKVLTFPKPEPDSPVEDILRQLLANKGRVQRLVVVAQTDSDSFILAQALEDNVHPWDFIELARRDHLDTLADFVTPKKNAPRGA